MNYVFDSLPFKFHQLDRLNILYLVHFLIVGMLHLTRLKYDMRYMCEVAFSCNCDNIAATLLPYLFKVNILILNVACLKIYDNHCGCVILEKY